MVKRPNENDRQIGARVRSRRVMMGMSQETLGAGVGLTFQQIQKYEKGANRIGGSRMMQLATALKVNPSYFFGGDGGSETSALDPLVQLVQSDDARRLLEAFARVKGPSRAAIVNLVEAWPGSGGR